MTPLVFLTGCIGSRAALAYLAAHASDGWLRVMGWLAAVIACGFMAIYVGKLRPTGIETGGACIWWDSLRPVHAAMYAAFAWYAVHGARDTAWKFLAADVTLGLAAWTVHHSR